MAATISNLVGKFVPASLPAADTFAGQTVLVTGGTSGLGVAAAAHYLRLGAREVVITAREASSPRAEAAKQAILNGGGKRPKKNKKGEGNSSSGGGEVTVMGLDMNSYASICAFVEALRHKYDATGGLGVVVLNAGVLNTEFIMSPEGAEETIQVNTLSTTLLALLLLPWLKQQTGGAAAGGKPVPHLVFVGSGSHLEPDIKPWPSYVEADGGVMAHYGHRDNFPTGAIATAMYATSKLMLQYAVEEVSKLARGSDGEPQVIITSVCPGPVTTGITRHLEASSVVLRLVMPLFFLAQSKSPDYGARIYINASVAKPDQHGKFLRDYLSDKQYERQSKPMISSPLARKMQAQVWGEIKDSLVTKVPAIRDILEQQQQPSSS